MFNLDVNTYTTSELKDIFQIKENAFANTSSLYEVLESRFQVLQNSIRENKKLDTSMQNKSIAFLSDAKHHLVQSLTPTIENGAGTQVKTTSDSQLNSGEVPWNVSGIRQNALTKKHTRMVTIDSKFHDFQYEDDKYNTNDFYVSLTNRLNKTESIELVEYSGPTSLRIISEEMHNNHFSISITEYNKNIIEKVITVPDFYRIERSILTSADIIKFVDIVNSSIKSAGGHFENCRFEFQHEQSDSTNLIGNLMDRTLMLRFDTRSYPPNKHPKQLTCHFDRDINNLPDKTHVPQKLGHMLGFRSSSTKLIIVSNIISRQTLPSPIDLIGFKYAYLVIDDFQSNSERSIVADDIQSTIGTVNNVQSGGNILAKINYRNEMNYNLSNRIVTTPRVYFGPVDIQKMHIRLINEYGDLIDTKGSDWSFTLRVITSYA
jgi:hypothetical protein|uniref:Uncharacterized protein n=1 Tax=viral metagenome TaxID=1070528 RepID=A0A6C0JAH4_9ZZZZ